MPNVPTNASLCCETLPPSPSVAKFVRKQRILINSNAKWGVYLNKLMHVIDRWAFLCGKYRLYRCYNDTHYTPIHLEVSEGGSFFM